MASASRDEFHLIVPNESQSAEVKLGSDVTIPCHLSPEISAVDMEIRWFKETDCACLYKKKEVIEGRSYQGRTGLSTEELNKGNVSLNLREFKESDMGVYLCQVISEDRTEEIIIEVEERKDSDGQPVNQSSKIQGRQVHLILHESNRTWGENQRMKMEESALMTEFEVNYVKVLHQTIFKVFKNQGKKLEQTELQLKESKTDLERVLQQLETITEKFGLLENKKDLDMKEPQMQQIEKQLLQITKYTEEKQNQLEEKDTQLENMSKQISEKEKLLESTIKEMETSKQQLEALRQEQMRQQELLEKKEQLRISELNEKSKYLEETKSLLEEREGKIKSLEKEKDRLNEELQDKDKRLKDINAKLIQTVREVEKKQNQLQGKHTQLENMHKMLSEKMRRPENKELEASQPDEQETKSKLEK
ncbi:Butyrophilin-like protein 9 [Anabarilius grahami]|uniref:Butyrophilin-like protein 9 n=1 Tax=Anabarilius grahami TaxID=495550 RepID=A0A3N0XI90_ANAGA|nr:Butyrophilin-like protein 9 [Anabarilius grahami]